MQITVDELRRKFLQTKISPYGDCIVVPGAEFDPDWEVYLGDHGYSCINTGYRGKAVTLVCLKKTLNSTLITVESGEIPPSSDGDMKTPDVSDIEPTWSQSDEAKIIESWNARSAVNKIAELFPEHSKSNVYAKIRQLQKKGKIEQRFKKKRRRKRKGKKKLEARSVPAPPSKKEIIEQIVKRLDQVIEVIALQTIVLDKQACAQIMQALQIREMQQKIAIPPGLWVHYANALLESDQKFRDIFREKAQKLLEVSE